jgi:ATP-dependent helicase HrpB
MRLVWLMMRLRLSVSLTLRLTVRPVQPVIATPLTMPEYTLPIEHTLPELLKAIRTTRTVVLTAAPGAGKTTRVPPFLLDQYLRPNQKLVLLEPRRLAAQRAAYFIASQRGERIGQTVGYRIRGDMRVSHETRIEVVTEGILARMLHHQPDLPGVGLIIFDEFHERSIHADLGLALTLDAQAHLRSDLRILIMSATLDSSGMNRFLPEAAVINSPGKSYPVTTHYRAFSPEGHVESQVVQAIQKALTASAGDILVFLPGQREIRRSAEAIAEAMQDSTVEVHQLYGESTTEMQQAALAPAALGHRKIILATSIAETSLTIDGVRIVIDAGLARGPRFDPRRGMSGLATGPVSVSSADQRRGRAGRQAPGICYRLWTEEQQSHLQPHPEPEILNTDLAPLALDLARWGNPEGAGLRFMDPPPIPHLAQARRLLSDLGALDGSGTLTAHGRAMAEIPVHPRLAHMLLRGKEFGSRAAACDVAAILEGPPLLRGQPGRDIDLHGLYHALHKGGGVDRGARERILAESRRLNSLLGDADVAEDSLNPEVARVSLGSCVSHVTQDLSVAQDPERILGILLAMAYPERIARRRGTGRFYLMAGGTGATLPEWSQLARNEFLSVGEVDGVGTDVRIFLAAPLTREEITTRFAQNLREETSVKWSTDERAVIGRRAIRLGAVTIAEQGVTPTGDQLMEGMLAGVEEMGLGALPWSDEVLSLRNRNEWLRTRNLVPGDWPELSDRHLLATLGEWLGPFLAGKSRATELASLDLLTILRTQFAHAQLKDLERLAPAALTLPSGTRATLDYTAGDQPVMAVGLQEMFGQTDSPAIAGGRIAVLIHLLSPAGRPLAVTADLKSFWANAYQEVRKQMRGRYPKHRWPENPLEANPGKSMKAR